MVAGFVLLRRDLCWKSFVALGRPHTKWALKVLAEAGFTSAQDIVENCQITTSEL
jgi:hypothetical protein